MVEDEQGLIFSDTFMKLNQVVHQVSVMKFSDLTAKERYIRYKLEAVYRLMNINASIIL